MVYVKIIKTNNCVLPLSIFFVLHPCKPFLLYTLTAARVWLSLVPACVVVGGGRSFHRWQDVARRRTRSKWQRLTKGKRQALNRVKLSQAVKP